MEGIPQGQPQPNNSNVDMQDKTPDNASNPGLDYASKFNELTNREKKLTDFFNQNKDLADKIKWVKSGKWQEDPERIFEMFGVENFQDFARHFIPKENQKPPSSEDVLESLKKKIADLEEFKTQTSTEKEQTKQQEAVAKFKDTIRSEIDDHEGEDFEAIKAFGAYDYVYDLIDEHFMKTKQVMDVREAAKTVENFLIEEVKASQEKAKNLSKLREIKQENPRTLEQAVKITPRTGNTFADTLTNSTETSSPKNPSSPYIKDEEASKRRSAEFLRQALRGY